MPTSVALALASFGWMGLAVLARRAPRLHAAMMGALFAFDLGFPVYLYLTHDWWGRLIERQEILSFFVWAHVALCFLLYGLYLAQLRAGLRLLRREPAARDEHRSLAKGLVAVRVFVLVTGALLVEPG